MANKTIVITRFDPDKDERPHKQEYKVPCEANWKVLDAVNFIKDEIDATVSHRWSCRMAVCGSCGMMVNGEPKLTCKTSINDYGDRIDIEPSPTSRSCVTSSSISTASCTSSSGSGPGSSAPRSGRTTWRR